MAQCPLLLLLLLLLLLRLLQLLQLLLLPLQLLLQAILRAHGERLIRPNPCKPRSHLNCSGGRGRRPQSGAGSTTRSPTATNVTASAAGSGARRLLRRLLPSALRPKPDVAELAPILATW